MRRELPTIVLFGTHLVLTGMAIAFHFSVRPQLLALHEQEKSIHPAAHLALSPWLLPLGIGAGIVIASVAWSRRKRSDRLRFLAVAAGVVAVSFLGAASGGYLPLLL